MRCENTGHEWLAMITSVKVVLREHTVDDSKVRGRCINTHEPAAANSSEIAKTLDRTSGRKCLQPHQKGRHLCFDVVVCV